MVPCEWIDLAYTHHYSLFESRSHLVGKRSRLGFNDSEGNWTLTNGVTWEEIQGRQLVFQGQLGEHSHSVDCIAKNKSPSGKEQF